MDTLVGGLDEISDNLDDRIEDLNNQVDDSIRNPQNYIRPTLRNEEWQCLLCFRRKNDQKLAMLHVKTHVSCEKCGKNWAGKLATSLHKSHVSNNCQGPKKIREKKYACQYCGQNKRRPGVLKDHIKTCQFKKAGAQTRFYPDQVTSSGKYLKKIREYICDFCGKIFSNRKANYNRHVETCFSRPEIEDQSFCSKCCKKFANPYRKSIHNCGHNCPNCGTNQKFPYKLRRHLKTCQSPVVKQEEILENDIENDQSQVPVKQELFENVPNAVEQPMIIDDDQVLVKQELLEHDEVLENAQNVIIKEEPLHMDQELEDDLLDDLEDPLDQPETKIQDPAMFIRQNESDTNWQCLLCFDTKSSRFTAIKHVKTHRCCDFCGKNWAGGSAAMITKRHLNICDLNPEIIKAKVCPWCGKVFQRPAWMETHAQNCEEKRPMIINFQVPVKQDLFENVENAIENVIENSQNAMKSAAHNKKDEIEQSMIIDDQVLVKLELLEHGEVLENAENVIENAQNAMKSAAPTNKDEIEQPMIIDDQVLVKQVLLEHGEVLENDAENIIENVVEIEEEPFDMNLEMEDDLEDPLEQPETKIQDPERFIRKNKSDSNWQCLLCFFTKSSRYLALRHVKTHQSCDFCGKNWAGKRASVMRSKHLKTNCKCKTLICFYCQRDLVMPSRLRKHILQCQKRPKTSATKTEYVCGYCGKWFQNRKKNHENHEKICNLNPEIVKTKTCPCCGKVFERPGWMECHAQNCKQKIKSE
jgi:hypothetical protein